MPYTPPTGDDVDLIFSGSPPPMQTGENLVLAFNIGGTVVTTTVQGVLANGLGIGIAGISAAGATGQGQQKAEFGPGITGRAVFGVETKMNQGSQNAELIAIYRPPNATNIIIDLGGVYSPQLGNNVIIDLGDLTDAVFYNKFQFFIADTALF